jgi:pyridoxal phosphate enzyme (YggS family)
MSTIAENLSSIKQRIKDAAERSGHQSDEIQLLVVSKTWPAEAVREIVDCGEIRFGESRLQEAEEKLPKLPSKLDWHFIGHLQTNKVKRVLELFPTIHSIDSLKLAQRVDRIAAELGCYPKVFLEVNVATESSKHGFSPNDLRRQFEQILSLERIDLQGLMAIPPAVPKPEDARPYFRQVRELQEELAQEFSVPMLSLSMGMSADFEVAIEEGATIVRVGSHIFGSRS